MAKYLLDTDWAIYYLRGKDLFVKTVDELRKEGIAISTISVAELYEGVFRNPMPEKKEVILLNFLEGLRVINITKPVARLFGKKRAELKVKGFTVSDLDLLIACVADYHDLTILTNNKKHFERIPDIKGLVSLPV